MWMVDIDNLQNLIQDWKSSVVNIILSSGDLDRLAEYSLQVSRILAYPDLDIKDTLKKIDSMSDELSLSIKKLLPLRPTQLIEEINNYLYNVKGFEPNFQDYYNPLNSYLNVVLERKTGIPITLSILYMRIAQNLRFKLYPVNFPSHFLLKHVLDGDNSEIIIDPFNKGRIMDDYSLKELLAQYYPNLNIPLTHEFVEKATAAQVIVRMLNNLKSSYYDSHDVEKAEIANEMIICMDQYNPDAIRDKGMILLKKGNPTGALRMLSQYLEIDPEAIDVDAVLDIIRKIRSELDRDKT
jgi:regulator of sirC expression with transglutaminase-like and TPR domain